MSRRASVARPALFPSFPALSMTIDRRHPAANPHGYWLCAVPSPQFFGRTASMDGAFPQTPDGPSFVQLSPPTLKHRHHRPSTTTAVKAGRLGWQRRVVSSASRQGRSPCRNAEHRSRKDSATKVLESDKALARVKTFGNRWTGWCVHYGLSIWSLSAAGIFPAPGPVSQQRAL